MYILTYNIILNHYERFVIMWTEASMSLFKNIIAGSTLTAGVAYLAQETHRYHELNDTMKSIGKFTKLTPSPEITHSTSKEWLIIGRQSPGLARHDEDAPKDYAYELSSNNSLLTKMIKTHLDNEKHYNLFPKINFEVQRITSNPSIPRVLVKPEHMLSTEVSEIKDDTLYEIGFANKQAFGNITKEIPFYHSSLALRQLGLSSPADPDAVIMTGKEIKQIIAKTNSAICDAQTFTLYTSNCYSASLYALGKAIETIDNRKENYPKNNQDIKAISDVLSRVALDNFACGVSNNSVVNNEMTHQIPTILERRGLLEPEFLEERQMFSN